MKKRALVLFKGGLGNQIFTLNFIKFLEKNNFKVFAITDFYKSSQISSLNTEKREFYLDLNSYNTNRINSKLIINLISVLLNQKNKKFYKKIFSKIINSLIEIVEDVNLINMKKNKFIFIFDGYWQSYDLLMPDIELRNLLSKDKKFNFFNNFKVEKNSIAIHIRRSDYLNLKEELSVDYYIKAINYCKENIEDFKFTIFTDDIQWVKNNEIFNNINNINVALKENTVKDFISMAKCGNHIISNSTYSYLAAYINLNPKGITLAPYPWFKNLKFIDYDKIQNPNWLGIENE